MSADKLILYSQPGCPPCQSAVEFLTRQGIPFVKKDITEDPEAIDELIALGSRSTPTMKFGDKVMIGFRKDELLSWFA
jgi:glutaredoxin